MIRPFEYFRPAAADEVGRLLAGRGTARVLAGGTDLLVDMRGGARRPDRVVDIKGIGALAALVPPRGKEGWRIGACVVLNDLVEEKRLPACVREAAEAIATHQVRNRATAVGNICNASPAADMAPPLLVCGAAVTIRGPEGKERVVPLGAFFTGPKKSVLGRGEWVTGISLPALPAGMKTAFLKRQRVRGHDLAVVNVAAACAPKAGTLRVAVGACAPTPLLFDLGDLVGKRRGGAPKTAALAAEAWKRIGKAIAPISDNRGGAAYRREMVKLLVERAIALVV